MLYVYNAGNTIDLYEASSCRYLKTIDLDVDSSTGLFVLPATAPPTTSGDGGAR